MIVKNNLSGTYPVIVHGPNAKAPIWKQLLRCYKRIIQKVEVDDRLTILTWNNLAKGVLEESLDLAGVPHVVKGRDRVVWNNLMKFRFNLEVIDQVKTEYVMGLDSHDVLFLGKPKDVVDRFSTMDCSMLFNAETRFYPDLRVDYYQKNKVFQQSISQSKFCYLNAGAWIGRREFCREFWQSCREVKFWEMVDCSDPPKLYSCDQSVIHGVFNKYHPKVTLDYHCNIFLNVSFVSDDDVSILLV